MIPDKLTLKNFMCYKDAVLDLSGVHLACLSGENGAGKSSILEAITWALWGKARSDKDDDLIKKGEIEAEVDFVFTVGADQYRVNRRRSSKSNGQTVLNLYIRKPDGSWNNTGETGVRAIQEQINRVVRTRYDTFTNSAFLMQGKADSFTLKRPSERKEVLAEILELGQYDEYEKQAKTLAKEADQRRKDLEEKLKQLQLEISQRPYYEKLKQEAEDQLIVGKDPLRRQEEALVNLRARLKELQDGKRKYDDSQRKIADLQKRLKDLDESKSIARRKLNEAKVILDRREEIETGYKNFQEAKENETEFSRKLSLQNELQAEYNKLEREINKQRDKLQNQVDNAEQGIATATATAKELPKHEADQRELSERIKSLEATQTELEQKKTERATLQGDLKLAKAEQTRLEGELGKIKAKAERIPQPGDRCEQCGTVLSEDAREHNLTEYRKEYKQVQDQIKLQKEAVEKINTGIKDLDQQITRLEQAVLPLKSAQQQSGSLEKSINVAREAHNQITIQAEKKAAFEKQLAAGDYALAEQQKIAGVKAQLAALNYDKEAHREIQTKLEDLKRFETEHNRLDLAVGIVEREEETLQRYALDEQGYQSDLLDWQAESQRLEAEIKLLPDIATQAAEAEQSVKQAKDRQTILQKQLWEANSKIENCNKLELEREKVEAEHTHAAEDRAVYDELAQAFGKKGIQAMVIDSVLPEIEDEANRLLGEMTDGRMHVRFDTQRESKKGDAIETLDLYISDEYGPRPYELYSGGEAFRVNFAVRVALSKLLTRRSGAQLRTLFIDEGFGSQDEQGRERLVDIIRSIEPDFDRILVITHIQELKDVFPVRIDVIKTPGGSQITVN